MHCREGGGTLAATNGQRAFAIPTPCHRWECPICGPPKVTRLHHRLKRYRPNRFLTLTCNPAAFHSPTHAYAHMSRMFTRLIKHANRHLVRTPITYFLVWERTRAGWPHIHALLKSDYLAQAYLSKLWAHYTGARVVDIRPVKYQPHMKSYLEKYITKNLAAPKGFKRFRASRDALGPALPKWSSPGDPPYTWRFLWLSMQMTYGFLEGEGYIMHWLPDDTLEGIHLSTLG